MRLFDQAEYDPTTGTLSLWCSCPGAERVYVLGEFMFGQPRMLDMQRSEDGRWRLRLSLPPGEYRYRYYVQQEGALTCRLPDADRFTPGPLEWDALLKIAGMSGGAPGEPRPENRPPLAAVS